MKRFLLSTLFTVGLVGSSAAQSDAEKLKGTWEITAMVDDGALVPDDLLHSRFALNGRFTISGQTISFLVPATLQKRTILFVNDEKANPKTIDLAGADKTAGKGIYLLSDDVLMLCLGEPDAKQRPTEFTAKKGSPYLLLTLKRVKANADTPKPPQPIEPPPPPAVTKDDELRTKLLGTWGHQDDDWVTMFTINGDGTFSSNKTFKKKFGKLFHEDIRSSGNWKLQNGVVLCTITASTDRDMRDQIFSYRIRSISATELIAVDQFGGLRREWKSR